METRSYSAFRLSYRSGGSYGKTENIAKTRCFRTDTRIIPHNKLLAYWSFLEDMLMNGYIEKYFEDRCYGFILGENDQSYYFRKNDIDIKIISLGQLVVFSPQRTDRGFKATNIVSVKSSGFIFEYCDEFTVKDDNGQSLLNADYVASPLSASGDSPDEAKEKLFRYIKSLGANGVRQLEYFKTKGHDGNYTFTIHNYRGNPALVFKKTPSTDVEKIKRSKTIQTEIIKSFELKYNEFINENKTKDKDNSGCLFGVVISFFILMLVALGNQHA